MLRGFVRLRWFNYIILVPLCKLDNSTKHTGTTMLSFVHIAYWYRDERYAILNLILLQRKEGDYVWARPLPK